MAIPAIWRASDNYLISDKCVAYGRWQEQTGVQENELLIGGIYHMEELGDESNSVEVTFLFADDRPTSTLANLEALKVCRRKVRPVIFRDYQGVFWECMIVTDINVEPRGENRRTERNNATFTLRRDPVVP